jgi:hypothetical protein
VIAIAWRAQRRLNQRWRRLYTGTAQARRRGGDRLRPRARRLPLGGRHALSDHAPAIAPGTLPGRARPPRKAHHRRARLATELWAAGRGRQCPLLDGEPRRIPGLEVQPSHIRLTLQSPRLDLPARAAPGTPQRRRLSNEPKTKTLTGSLHIS